MQSWLLNIKTNAASKSSIRTSFTVIITPRAQESSWVKESVVIRLLVGSVGVGVVGTHQGTEEQKTGCRERIEHYSFADKVVCCPPLLYRVGNGF